jgi:AraC-like DNA-binding protein
MDHSTRGIDYQEVPRPLGVLSDHYPAGFHDPPHRHSRAQLIYAPIGEMLVVAERASFLIPSQRAVWIPAGVEHEVHVRSAATLRSLYVRPGATVCATLREPQVVEVTPLLKALILEAARFPVEYLEDGREGRIVALLLEELSRGADTSFTAPMPMDPRLVHVCTEILKEPSHRDGLDEWAYAAGVSRRTFTRMFRSETGMSFAAWRHHVRLIEAVGRLSRRQHVTTVALDVGYNSPSAFTAAFRKAFGVSPSRFQA